MAMSKIEVARKASGLTIPRAAEVIGKSERVYREREKDPFTLTFSESQKLYNVLTDDGKSILRSWVAGIFLPSEDI